MARTEKQNRAWLHTKLSNYLWKIKDQNAYGSLKKQETIYNDLKNIIKDFGSNINRKMLRCVLQDEYGFEKEILIAEFVPRINYPSVSRPYKFFDFDFYKEIDNIYYYKQTGKAR